MAAARPAARGRLRPVLVGVVGSGNLEVMLEPLPGADCEVRVETSARGFGPSGTRWWRTFTAATAWPACG
jgi:malonate decarboxylase delta subunit